MTTPTVPTVRISIGEVCKATATAKGEPRFRLDWSLLNPDGSTVKRSTFHRDKAVMDVFRSNLLTAAALGKPFDQVTGLPAGLTRPHPSKGIQDAADRPLYADIAARLQSRWDQPGKYGERKGHTVKGLTNEAIAVSMALLRQDAPGLDLRQRKAARDWLRRQFVPADAQQRVAAADDAKRAAARGAGPKDKQQRYRWRLADERAAARAAEQSANDAEWAEYFDRHGLRWFETDPDAMRRAITALELKVDGTPAEPQTVTKHFVALNELMNWAAAHGKLPANPINSLERWERPSTTTKVKRVDQRQVPGMDLLLRLIDTCRELGLAGDPVALRVVVFIAVLALAGLRPSEARRLRVRDFRLPARGWGMVTFGSRTTTPGRLYTADGRPDEDGGMKWRPRTDLRDVPLAPMLVTLVRWHIEHHRLAADDYLVGDENGKQLPTSDIDRVWHQVRDSVFADPSLATFLTLKLKDLRHTRATLLLAARAVPESIIALWLGHHTTVLRTMYEGVITGSTNPYSDEIEHYRDQLVPPEYDGAGARSGASDDAVRMLRVAIQTGANQQQLLAMLDALGPTADRDQRDVPTTPPRVLTVVRSPEPGAA
jgi:integrase